MSHSSENNEARLRQLMALDDDTLLEMLAREETGRVLGFRGDQWYRYNGRRIFRSYRKPIAEAICGNSKVQALIRSPEATVAIGVAQTIVTLIEPIVHEGSAAIVAVLVLRYGLDKLCSEKETP